ncbi:hypothetical protein MAMO4S_02750 [Mesorhizobium amorphae]
MLLSRILVPTIAALTLMETNARADCRATSTTTFKVDVSCDSGGASNLPFLTSYSISPSLFYDGNLSDNFTMSGGFISTLGTSTPRGQYFGDPLNPSSYNLDFGANIDLKGGNDIVVITGGVIGDMNSSSTGSSINLNLGDGLNTLTMTGGKVFGSILGGSDRDEISISGNASVYGPPVGGAVVQLGDGNDQFTMAGGTLMGAVSGGAGNDSILISGGTITGYGGFFTDVTGDEGDDTIVITGGTVRGTVSGGISGDDTLIVTGGHIFGDVAGGFGNDTITVSGGTIDGSVRSGTGLDVVDISGGLIRENVYGGSVNIKSGTIFGSVIGRIDANNFDISGGYIAGDILGEDGNDIINFSGGTINGKIRGGAGEDTIRMSGGSVMGISGDGGSDNVTISGGTVWGDVTAETVSLFGGTIGGDIAGLSGSTLNIDDAKSPTPLVFRNGVSFSGTDAVGKIVDTNLAKNGRFTQAFSGFVELATDNSTLGFGGATNGIAQLNLRNSSILFINGNSNLTGHANVFNSTIQMIDGAADDVFTLGGLTLRDAVVGVDVNLETLQADQIVSSAFSAQGSNKITVNLLGKPEFSQATQIPIISTGAPFTGNFSISGLDGTRAALFTYELITSPSGNLSILATPSNFQIALAPQSAIDTQTVDTALNAFSNIENDTIVSNLDLAASARTFRLTPTLSVFASGQLARTKHDSLQIRSENISNLTPGYSADEFSAALTFDLNADEAFDLNKKYRTNFGLFGGYASSDIVSGASGTFDRTGTADNNSGVFGGYGLFRQDNDYVIVSAAGFIGQTEITNDVLDTKGSYDTKGYNVTGSVGHILRLDNGIRFDLRGGISGTAFVGANYTDDGGNRFDKSRISFGSIQLEPGIYADYQLENGMVLSPFARLRLQQRFGYSNKAKIDGVEVSYDSADFTGALYGGFQLKLTERMALTSGINGKWSGDRTSIAGKLDLAIAF